MDKLINEYKTHLENLKKVNLMEFINKIDEFKKSKDNYFKKIEEYINQEIPEEFLNIFSDEEFIKLFYLDSQAEFILKKLNIKEDLKDTLKTLVYCYNTNQREFKKDFDLKNLEKDLFSRGFKKINLLEISEEDKKIKFNKLKVKIVMDFNKIGLLGSFDKKEEKEGKIIYSDYQKKLIFMPKRYRTRGFVIRGNFYYKELKGGIKK